MTGVMGVVGAGEQNGAVLSGSSAPEQMRRIRAFGCAGSVKCRNEEESNFGLCRWCK